MPNIKLTIQYNGAGFSGWQYQPNARTVQGELTRVLSLICHEEIEHVQSSGRTDAGVHARGQVVNFQTTRNLDLEKLKHSVGSLLKNEVAVITAEVVSDHFHALRSAVGKKYIYTILNRPAPPVFDTGFVWHIGIPLNFDFLQEQAAKLVGAHDFKSFQAGDCNAKTSVREIYTSEVIKTNDYLRYEVTGQGFLKNMVRIIVGTLVNLEQKKLDLADIEAVLEARDRRSAGVTAPAHGLMLEWVEY